MEPEPADLVSGVRSRFTLRFLDDDLECAFQTELGAASLTRSRRGLLQAAAMWCFVGLLLPVVTSSNLVRLESVVLFAVLLNLAGWVLIVRGSSALDRQQTLIAAVNGIAALCVLSLIAMTEASLFGRYGASGIMLATVFAQLVIRMRFVASVATSAPAVVGYALVAAFRAEPGSFAMGVFLTFSTFVVVAASSYALESTTRDVFHQKRIIAAQSAALEREKEKSDWLLLNVLPGAVAARLREEPAALAESFESATVLFADIVGFTSLAGRVTPGDLVGMLNDLFSRFDDLAERHGLEKIKTIGDAYMVVGGIPERSEDHAVRVAAMGLDMLRAVDEFARVGGLPIALRVGVHTGQVVAGVIGKKKFAYDLWGDTVNTASRMESHGVAGRVHVSEATYERLREGHALSERGMVDVKGKGPMRTWFFDGARLDDRVRPE